MNHGQDLFNPYTIITKILDEIPAAANFMENLSNITKIATDTLVLAKANQERNANKSWQDIQYDVGDQVLLSAYHINLALQANHPSKKL